MKYIILNALLLLGTHHASYALDTPWTIKDADGNTPLHRTTTPATAEFLLQHGAQIDAKNNNGCTFLHYAVMSLDPYLVKVALNHGADVNVQNNDGITPLMNAAIAGSLHIVKLLCSHGADVTLSDQEQRTALDYADDALMAGYSFKKEIIKHYLIRHYNKHHDEL